MEEIFKILMLLIEEHLVNINSEEDFEEYYEEVRINGELTQDEIDDFLLSSKYLYSVVKINPKITKKEYDKGYPIWLESLK